MNKIIFLIMALAIGAFGCSSMSDKAKQKRSGIVVYDSSKSKTAAGPIIKRDVKVSSGVMKLVNTTSADIEFRKGQPAVTIEGPQDVIDKLEI
ncbi:MAG: hypothetical protein K2G23_08365, partial [Muribaculaceae bacterium]|nr:hypothetical protein [Muribaculaceae bacterium]